MRFNKEMLKLYAITDRACNTHLSLYDQVEQALQGGVTIVQLREKELDEDAFIDEAKKLKKLCSRYNVPLIINDDLNVALKSGADGVHVGINDISVRDIRQKTSSDFIVGATAKTVEQAQSAMQMGADYLGVGAVFPSPTKPDAVRITKTQFNEIASSVNIPSVAIGGITLENAAELRDTSACGIAVVSALFSANDITDAARQFRKILP